MMENIHSSLVREMLTSGTMDIRKGELLVWDMPCIMFPLNSVLLKDAMKDEHPEMSMAELNYQIGHMQSYRGNKVLVQRYGFSADEQFMRETFGKSEILGQGVFEFIDLDLENKVFTVRNKENPYAKQYLKVFGKQDHAVCHFLRGLCTGSFHAFFDEELLGVETSCIARGNQECVITVKPKKKWDLSDPMVSAQVLKHKLPEMVLEEYYSWDKLVSVNAGKP